MKGENCVNKLMPRFSYRIVTIICGAVLLSGCVMAEKYDAEKARSLNFQRLLAQEEKRTGELDSEVKRSKNELMEYEARNRELTAQLQATRDQLARVQEESEAMKEFAQLERKAKTDMKRGLKSTRKAIPAEPTSDAVDLSASALGIAPDGAAVPGGSESSMGSMDRPPFMSSSREKRSIGSAGSMASQSTRSESGTNCRTTLSR